MSPRNPGFFGGSSGAAGLNNAVLPRSIGKRERIRCRQKMMISKQNDDDQGAP